MTAGAAALFRFLFVRASILFITRFTGADWLEGKT
jgi:hypothetical protein